MSLKGQASIEMFVMIGVAIAFIFPLAILFFSSSNVKVLEISKAQGQILAQRISEEAAKACYQGAGAKRMVIFNYPDKLLNLSINNTEVVVRMEAEGVPTEIVAVSPCNMTNAISSTGSYMPSRSISGIKRGRYVSAGLVSLVFLNHGTNVTVFRATSNNYGIG